MARQTKPPQSGAERSGSAPGKRKIGGDLQGEPIFRLSGPAAALQVPNPRPCSRTDTPDTWGDTWFRLRTFSNDFRSPPYFTDRANPAEGQTQGLPWLWLDSAASGIRNFERATRDVPPPPSGRADRRTWGPVIHAV